MKTFLAQNEYIPNSAPVAPRAETAVASLTLPAEGATAEQVSCVGVGRHANDPTGRYGVQVRIDPGAQETAATDPGRAVAATLTHNAVTQAVEIQSSCGSLEGQAERDQRLRKSSLLVVPPIGPNPETGAIIDSIPMAMEAGIKPGPQDHIGPHPDEDEVLYLLLKFFDKPETPNFPAIPDEHAFLSEIESPFLHFLLSKRSAPRSRAGDPVWDDPAPLFLQAAR